MQGKVIALAIASGLALTVATSASAVLSIPFGWYAELNVGPSHLTNKSYNGGSSSSSGLGGNLNVGYKFMPYVATEIGVTYYQKTTIKANNVTAATDRHYSYDLAMRGILPISDSGFEAFTKVGVGHIADKMSISNQSAASSINLSANSHTATGLYYGIGGQYYWTPALAFNLQWQTAIGNGSTGTESLLSIGLSYIFDY